MRTRTPLRRLALGTALVAGPFVMGLPAQAAAPDVDVCSGPVLTAGDSSGVTAESVQWKCTDNGSGHSAAVLYFNSLTTFWGTWYDNACTGDVHGNRVGSVLVGRVDFVRCTGVPDYRQGQFTLTYQGLVGEMTVEYGTTAI